VPNATSGTISRVHGSDGKLLGTWTGAEFAVSIVVARGRIYAAGSSSPGKLYRFDPRQAPQDVTIVTSSLGDAPNGITADESFIWTANSSGSVSRFNPLNSAVTTFQAGFQAPLGILYDGANIWVTDTGDDTLKKLNSNGTVNQSIPVGLQPFYPVFDGTSIWVPNYSSDSVTVVRVKDPQGNPLAQSFVLATLTGNGLDHPVNVAFDGQRILVTDFFGDAVSLWRATDLTPLASFSSPSNSGPYGACSDGVNFWVTLVTSNKLARF
jgi:streptogramin lyase